MDDGLAAKYADLLENDHSRAGTHLARMFGELTDTNIDGKLMGIFSKLVKIYGARLIYFSVLDVADMDNVRPGNPAGLLSYFAKKRLEKMKAYPQETLEDFINKQRKDLGKNKKVFMRNLDE